MYCSVHCTVYVQCTYVLPGFLPASADQLQTDLGGGPARPDSWPGSCTKYHALIVKNIKIQTQVADPPPPLPLHVVTAGKNHQPGKVAQN